MQITWYSIIGEFAQCDCFADGLERDHNLTHEVGDRFTHGGSEDEVLQHVGDEREGHAEDSHHQVTDCQRQQERVGDRAHALVDRQDHNDQQVAKHTEEEDYRVEQDTQRVHLWREEEMEERGG